MKTDHDEETKYKLSSGSLELRNTQSCLIEQKYPQPGDHHQEYTLATGQLHVREEKLHAFFMWAAFKLGFTYERWEQFWHCMIKKLFEGDINTGLKYLTGKK